MPYGKTTRHGPSFVSRLEPRLKTPSLSPSPAEGTTQAESSWQGRMTEGNSPVGPGLALAAACVTLTGNRREGRNPAVKEWVFWTRSYDAESGGMEEGPYRRGRYSMLRKICRDAGGDYHTFHRLRASGTSVMNYSGAMRTDGARRSIWKSSATWNATPWTSTKGKSRKDDDKVA